MSEQQTTYHVGVDYAPRPSVTVVMAAWRRPDGSLSTCRIYPPLSHYPKRDNTLRASGTRPRRR